MKSWNLSSFDEISPNILSFVNKDSSAEIPAPRRRRPLDRKTTTAGLSATAVLVAAITFVSVQLDVAGSGDQLRLSSTAAVTNFQVDRPPLTLLFGAKHHLKWDIHREHEMLHRAAKALAASTAEHNERNLIHSVEKETLPIEREHWEAIV